MKGETLMKKIDFNKAYKIIEKFNKKKGNSFVKDGIWDLDEKLQEIGEALKGLRAVKVGRLLKQAQGLSDQVWHNLRDQGHLGPFLDFRKGKIRVFVDSRTIVKRIPLG